MEKLNVANRETKTDSERKRIPMSVPVQRLEVPELPGYHLHWFLGTAARIQRARDGGYEFVHQAETHVNARELGADTATSGNTDMGSLVSVTSGDQVGEDGQPVRMILMKIKQEWYDEDQKLVDERNERVAASLRGGLIGAEKDGSGDTNMRYVDKSRTKLPDLFTPKPRKKA